MDEGPQTDHRLISTLAEGIHAAGVGSTETFTTQLELRSELVVAPVALPKCLALVDPASENLSVDEFDRLAPEALEEVEVAMRELWQKQATGKAYSPRAQTEGPA